MDFSAPHFENPLCLWVAGFALAGLGALIFFASAARRRQLAVFVDDSVLGRLLQTYSPLRRAIKDGLILVAVALLGVALARPQWGQQSDTSAVSGETPSSFSIPPRACSRQTYGPIASNGPSSPSRTTLRRHANGRVGLVVFAGQAFLQCPLTLDYDAFSDTLRSVDVNAIPVPGSDLGRALDEGSRALEKNEGRKLLVLLTDGEDLAGSGVRKAAELVKKDIVIYTVGVGTPAGSVIRCRANREGFNRSSTEKAGQW
jgi:Ca-activated chloride channel family protein